MKKNLPLIVALAIPVALTILIAASIYLPGMGKSPKYDFIYTSYTYRGSGNPTFDVVDGKIVDMAIQNESHATLPEDGSWAYPKGFTGDLNYYDVETDTSKPLTIEEAGKFKIDTATTSPDGYQVRQSSNSGVFPFFNDYEYNHYLVGNNRRIKTSVSGYDNNFLGWVVNQ